MESSLGFALDNPFREWIGPDGEPWLALHPFFASLCVKLASEGRAYDLNACLAYLAEHAVEGAPVDPELMERALEIDAEQRANGYSETV